MTVEQENDYLKEENRALKAKLEEADAEIQKVQRQLALSKTDVRNLYDYIKRLEGQIEAYQYCLNSIFLR